MHRLNCIFGAGLAALLLTLPAFPGPVYTITNLGNLGMTDITATGINSNGQVTGFGTTSQGDYHAFLWVSGLMSDLGVSASSYESQTGKINSSGVIAGTQTGGAGTQASYWSGGAYSSLGGVGSSASGINDAGQIVGQLTAANSQGHAFRASGGSIQDLGTLQGGTWSSAYDINSGGSAVGYGDTPNGSFRGFVTNADGGMSALGTLGGRNSYAMAINDAGQVAGSASNGAGYIHASTWNNGSIFDLGTLGGSSSFAYDINNSGSIVGYSYLSNLPDSHAFVYRDGVLYDLNGLISSGSGWTLLNAYGINDNGQIVGSGLWNGELNAFLLNPQSQGPSQFNFKSTPPSPDTPQGTIPEPETIVFAGLGLALITAYRLILNRCASKTILPPSQPE
jgi:probable HAF family extracellular repeat protein